MRKIKTCFSHILFKFVLFGLLAVLTCQSFAKTLTPRTITVRASSTPPPSPPPPPPPSVSVYGGDPGDPDPGDTDSCSVNAGINNPPTGQNEDTLVGHWSWSVGGVSVTPYAGGPPVNGSAGTFNISLTPISDPGKPDDGTIDDTNPAATFTGTFLQTGYYSIPITATVHYIDTVTGQDAGTYSGTGYVGDPQDNPAYDPTQTYSGSAATPGRAGAQPNGPTPPPAPKPLPNNMVVSGIFASLPNPVKLGLYSAHHATETYTVTVKPAAAAGSVSFTVANGVASATPTLQTTTNAQGQSVPNGSITLVIAALKPSGSPSGDALTATRTSTGKVVGTATVLVLCPTTLDPTPAFGPAPITAQKVLLNNLSVPSDPSYTSPVVGLFVSASTTLSMQVRDQFHQPLDAIFAGTSVSEKYLASENNGNAVPLANINSPISSGGTYADSAGFLHENSVASPEPNANTGYAQNWSGTGPFPAPPDGTQSYTRTDKIHVYIGGHELNPSPAVQRSSKLTFVTNNDGSTTLTLEVTSL